jgi:hypothetical protein
MILFYDNTGKVYATIEGRVHDKEQIKNTVDAGNGVNTFIIGWEETEETEMVEQETERLVEIAKDFFKKVKIKEKVERPVMKEHNMKYFKLLQKFEDGKETPMRYKVINNKLVK